MLFKSFFLKLKDFILCRAKINCRSTCCVEEEQHTPNITINGNGSPIINIRTIQRSRSPHRHPRRERPIVDSDGEPES